MVYYILVIYILALLLINHKLWDNDNTPNYIAQGIGHEKTACSNCDSNGLPAITKASFFATLLCIELTFICHNQSIQDDQVYDKVCLALNIARRYLIRAQNLWILRTSVARSETKISDKFHNNLQ